jgi:hypothetical protein
VSTLFLLCLPFLRIAASPLCRVKLSAQVRQATLIYYQEIFKHHYSPPRIPAPILENFAGIHKLSYSEYSAFQKQEDLPILERLCQAEFRQQAVLFYTTVQFQESWTIVSYTT